MFWPSALGTGSLTGVERATLDQKFYEGNKTREMPAWGREGLTRIDYRADRTWRLHFEVEGRPFAVRYDEQGRPDFRPFMYRGGAGSGEVVIPVGTSRNADKKLATKMAGFAEGQPGGYTWHHAELFVHGGVQMYRMQLVQSDVHGAASHSGAVSTSKKQKE
jgi:hypothetical protein